MAYEIGQIEAIYRYPVKSMAGERIQEVELGWHGLEGDRRLAFRRLQDVGGFPWLTAGKLPEMLLFTPLPQTDGKGRNPTHVRTPDGRELEIDGEDLAAEIGRRCRGPVQLMRLNQGIFDDATVSVITLETILELAQAAECDLDVRRFRPNLLIKSLRPIPFEENGWVGGVLSFGDPRTGPAVSITTPDPRCSMVNLDPDSVVSQPKILKAVVRLNKNNAGAYGTVVKSGTLAVGQTVRLEPAR